MDIPDHMTPLSRNGADISPICLLEGNPNRPVSARVDMLIR
jgi:hypothetical protein